MVGSDRVDLVGASGADAEDRARPGQHPQAAGKGRVVFPQRVGVAAGPGAEHAVDDGLARPVQAGADLLEGAGRELHPAVVRAVFPEIVVGRDGEGVVVTGGIGDGADRQDGPGGREHRPAAVELRAVLPQRIVREDGENHRVAGRVPRRADLLEGAGGELHPAGGRVFPQAAIRRDGEDVRLTRGIGGGADGKNGAGRREHGLSRGRLRKEGVVGLQEERGNGRLQTLFQPFQVQRNGSRPTSRRSP